MPMLLFKDEGLREENLGRIIALRDRHKGERCIVAATGPSLLETPIHLLENQIVIGVNTIFNPPKTFVGPWGFAVNPPQYHTVSDREVFKKWYRELFNLDPERTTLILGLTAAQQFLADDKYKRYLEEVGRPLPILLDTIPGNMWVTHEFSKDLTRGTVWGFTVVIDVSLQLAYWMGFPEVYLIGCDHTYDGKMDRFDGTRTEVIAGGAAGDWGPVFGSHEVCKVAFEEDGRKVFNSTVGGMLEIYPRISLEEVFG